jgi:heat shock protein HslJ
MRNTFIALAVIIGLAAAMHAAGGTTRLAGSVWTFADAQDPKARYVEFTADRHVQGSGGCNRFTGTFMESGETLKIGPLAATRMACPPEIMQLENAFFQMLAATKRAEIIERDLVLRDEDGAELGRLVRRAAEQP